MRQLSLLKVWGATKKETPCLHWENTPDLSREWKESPLVPRELDRERLTARLSDQPHHLLPHVSPQQWGLLQTFCPFPSPTFSMHLNEAPSLGGGSSCCDLSHGGSQPHTQTGGPRGEVKISAAQRDDYGAAPKLSCFTAGPWACVGIIVLEYLMLDWLGCFVFDHILKCDLTVGVGN